MGRVRQRPLLDRTVLCQPSNRPESRNGGERLYFIICPATGLESGPAGRAGARRDPRAFCSRACVKVEMGMSDQRKRGDTKAAARHLGMPEKA
ncbi:hypothetical protein J6590_007819 [Homalodisca vitripennis]|nr:hypothetical protein J6590_007819 [Homalodisca vitripennis]